MENTLPSQPPPPLRKKHSISQILDRDDLELPKYSRRRSSTVIHSPISSPVSVRRRVICIRVTCVTTLVAVWLFFIIPSLLIGYEKSKSKDIFNVSVNELLLESINLSDVKLRCPDQYVYSPISKTCSPACGKWSNCGYPCLYIWHLTYAGIALAGVILNAYALLSWVILRNTWQFHHHPILICIIINLLQSVAFSVSDIPGAFLFYCTAESKSWDVLNQDPGIHIQVQGTLIHLLALSNRLWFTFALFLILLKVIFPFKKFFEFRKNRVWAVFIELTIGFGIPLLTEIATYATGTRYKVSAEIFMPIANSSWINALFGYIPHALITSFTITLVILILYKTRLQSQRIREFGEGYQLQTIEKRLLIFSILYFLVGSVIVVSITVHSLLRPKLTAQFNDYLAAITIDSEVVESNTAFFNGTVRDLLTLDQQSTIQKASKPFLIYLRGFANRLMFIVVFAVLTVSCNLRKKTSAPQVPRKQSRKKSCDSIVIRNNKVAV